MLKRIDEFCDRVPRRSGDAEEHGPLRLFVRRGDGFPLYARPVPGGAPVAVADVERVRARQRELGIAETFEWVLAQAPTMTDAARGSGLDVRICPVLVLDGPVVEAPFPPGYTARLLGPADGDLAAAAHAQATAVGAAFGMPAPGAPSAAELSALRTDLADGAVARVLVTGPDGPVAGGAAQRAGDVVELVGIGTVPGGRGRGLGAAVTARLATAARSAGADVVFLSAGDDTATRVYERVGFRKVGECGLTEPG